MNSLDTPAPQDFTADIQAIRSISAVRSILEVACQVTGMGFAAVARVTEDRWIACEVLDHVQFGLRPGSELPIKTTLCDEVRAGGREIVIDHVARDGLYQTHHTPRLYGLESYISVPIVLRDGTFFGTLCAIDAKPATLKSGSVVPMFKLFAELIAGHLDDRRVLLESQAKLAQSEEAAELREQFIAVLGHDLRNPIAAVQNGVTLLKRNPPPERATAIVAMMEQTVARMGKLVANILDLALGQLGGGIEIAPEEARPLATTLEQIVMETRAAYPDREIEVRFELNRPVAADHARIGQLFSNLLVNAVTHGSQKDPIQVAAKIREDAFELSVSNRGPPIPTEAIERLFQPFYRGNPSRRSGGLGLGLYIASQIAAAHGGTLDVAPDADGATFTFRMPVTPPKF
jgi:signal transduction histidine kinase